MVTLRHLKEVQAGQMQRWKMKAIVDWQE